MMNIIGYFKILETSREMLSGYGRFPDTNDSGYRNIRQIYDISFSELVKCGIPYKIHENTAVICTDGIEYGSGLEIICKNLGTDTHPGTGHWDNCEVPADEPSFENERDYEDTGIPESNHKIAANYIDKTQDIPLPAGNNQSNAPDIIQTQQTDHAASDNEENSDREINNKPVEETEEDKDIRADEESSAEVFIAEPDTDNDSPEIDTDSVPEDPDDIDNAAEAGAEEADNNTYDDIPEITPDEEEYDTGSETGNNTESYGNNNSDGTDADAGKPLINVAENNKQAAARMPDHMDKKDFTFNLGMIEISVKGNSERHYSAKAVIVPLAIDKPDPEILVCLFENGKAHVKKSHGAPSLKVMADGYPVTIEGHIKDGSFVSKASLPELYTSRGIILSYSAKGFGNKGHIVLDDDENNVHIHIMPASFVNNKSGNSEFIYYINNNGEEIIGSSNRKRFVTFDCNGKEMEIICRWDERVLKCFVDEFSIP